MTRKLAAPSSKPRKAPKGAKTKPPSAEGAEGQEGALPGQHRPVHSRARAKLAEVCARLRGGTPINHACALEGVPRQSFYELIGSDEDAALQVAAARAEGAEEYRTNLVSLALGGGAERANANVLLHLMERLYPDDYAPPKQRVGLEGGDEGSKPVELKITIGDAVSGASGEIPK
jgi:hypothetical protein